MQEKKEKTEIMHWFVEVGSSEIKKKDIFFLGEQANYATRQICCYVTDWLFCLPENAK